MELVISQVLQRTVVAFKLDMDQLIGDIIMTSCHYIHCFIMYMSKYFMSSSNDLIRAMTETNTTNNKRNEWIVTSIKFSFNKENCHDLSVESFVIVRQCNGQEQVKGGAGHIFESSNKNSVNVTENDDSIRILQ